MAAAAGGVLPFALLGLGQHGRQLNWLFPAEPAALAAIAETIFLSGIVGGAVCVLAVTALQDRTAVALFLCALLPVFVLYAVDQLITPMFVGRYLFFTVPPSYHMARVNPLQGFLGAPAQAPADDGVALWEVPLIAPELATQSGGICMRVLAHVLLSGREREEWRLLQGSVRRHREWLSGRAALKEAVRYWIHQQSGELVHAADVDVLHDEHGAPWVDGWWNGTLVDAPRVSLSHSGEACLAAVAPPDLPVGVDFEPFGRVRQPELVAQSLGAPEHALLAGLQGAALEERVLRLWCAKEAAAKCLGIGLQGEPAQFVVAHADARCENLQVEHPLGSVEVRVVSRHDAVVAVATPAAEQPRMRGYAE